MKNFYSEIQKLKSTIHKLKNKNRELYTDYCMLESVKENSDDWANYYLKECQKFKKKYLQLKSTLDSAEKVWMIVNANGKYFDTPLDGKSNGYFYDKKSLATMYYTKQDAKDDIIQYNLKKCKIKKVLFMEEQDG